MGEALGLNSNTEGKENELFFFYTPKKQAIWWDQTGLSEQADNEG